MQQNISIDSLKYELEERVIQLNHIQEKLDKIVTESDLEKQYMKKKEKFQSDEIKKLWSEQKMLKSINEHLQIENNILQNIIEHEQKQQLNSEAQKQLYQKNIVLQNQINQLNSQLDAEKVKIIKYIQDHEQQHKEIFNTNFLEKNIRCQKEEEYQTIFQEWEKICNEENILLAKISSLNTSEDLNQLNNDLEVVIMNVEMVIQLINEQIRVKNTLKVLLLALNFFKNLKELLKSQDQQLYQILAKINDNEAQLTTIRQNLKKMNQQTSRDAEIEINQLKSKLQQQNIQIEHEKNQLRKQINDLQIECQSKIKENNQEQLKNQKIQTQAQKLQIDLNFCQEEKTKLQAQLQKWESELNINQEENFKLKDLQIQLETKIKENSQIQSQNENIQSQLNELQHKLNLNLEQKDQQQDQREKQI